MICEFGTVGVGDIHVPAEIPSDKRICKIHAHQKLFFRADCKQKKFMKQWRPS